MKVSSDLRDARINVSRAAELAVMHAAHFRRLVRRGVLPAPKRNTKGKPYYDYDLLQKIADVLRRGVGCNGEDVGFYRRRLRPQVAQDRPAVNSRRKVRPAADEYVASLAEGLRQLGIADELLTPVRLMRTLAEAFGTERPAIETALPAIARQLLGAE